MDRIEDDLTAMCEDIVSEVRTLHPDRTVVFEPTSAIVGDFDNSRLGQVFSNLIENAIKHGSASSPITVSQQAEDDYGVFSIHNDGKPIAADGILRIFNPMMRHSQFAGDERGPLAGLGLGLFIAREIVTAHGGTIAVKSTAESGTTFRAKLPLHMARPFVD